MYDRFEKTYMDLNREVETVEVNDKWGIVAAIALFTMYAFVSSMDYQDCLRGAISC